MRVGPFRTSKRVVCLETKYKRSAYEARDTCWLYWYVPSDAHLGLAQAREGGIRGGTGWFRDRFGYRCCGDVRDRCFQVPHLPHYLALVCARTFFGNYYLELVCRGTVAAVIELPMLRRNDQPVVAKVAQ